MYRITSAIQIPAREETTMVSTSFVNCATVKAIRQETTIATNIARIK